MESNKLTSAGVVVSSGPLVAAGLMLVTQPDASAGSLLTGAFLIMIGAAIAILREQTKPASEESRNKNAK